jgi:hypothetical protein
VRASAPSLAATQAHDSGRTKPGAWACGPRNWISGEALKPSCADFLHSASLQQRASPSWKAAPVSPRCPPSDEVPSRVAAWP